jgi:chaperonin GroEL
MAIIRRAIEEPLRTLADNAGQEGALIVQEVKARKGNEGYNVATQKIRRPGQGRRRRSDQSDSAVRCKTPASISGLLLTTEAIITEAPEKEKAGRRNASGRHGWNGRNGRYGLLSRDQP